MSCRILIVKTSSMGDILHTFPAVTELAKHYPEASIDWLVEEAFAEIPVWHPAVHRVIPMAWRRWRKTPLAFLRSQERKQFFTALRETSYDYIIDCQGLFKSAFFARFAQGKHVGFSVGTVREKIATLFYQSRYEVPCHLHAIARNQLLLAKALGYTADINHIDYGLLRTSAPKNTVICIPNTSSPKKRWAITQWQTLLQYLSTRVEQVLIPEGLAHEHAYIDEIMKGLPENIKRLSSDNLTQVKQAIESAKFVVSVDTGLAHLAAALSVPCITLYTVTDPDYIGTKGVHQYHLTGPVITASIVIETLEKYV
jgi:heptosyltransferase-1